MLLLLFVALLPAVFADCPVGTISHPEFGRCYKFSTDRQPFYMAEEACQAIGGHLVSVENGFENAMLAETATSQNLKGPFFIGYNRMVSSDWSWIDGYNASTFTNWGPGQPSASSQCTVEALNGSWISVNCASSYPYVCAFTSNIPPVTCPTCPALPTCPAPPRQPGHCQNGWFYLKKTDSCYRYFLWATFEDAEQVCVSNGGHLASIHSSEENTFVADISKSGTDYKSGADLTWIGLKQANYPQDTKWTWTDGTPVDYMMWAPGQPDNYKGLEHCGQTHSDYIGKEPAKDTSYQHWNDCQCTTEMRAYVCKKPASH
ncbi:lectin C-type domain protein [Ancylostoma duodenale]|uniref:Lectin C-type domain protein n=1 Tax=Ancylostoma duodenale TaxID=51022 RepID=A0A0C2H6I0_9BILA|nr:lectin C-type domain protein [Ancylostoma duodenale]